MKELLGPVTARHGAASTISLLVGALAVVVLARASLGSLDRLEEYRTQSFQTYEIITAAEVLLSKLKDAEAGQRVHSIARREEFLQPYHAARVAIPARLIILQDLVYDDHAHQGAVARITGEVEAVQRALAEAVRLASTAAPPVQADHPASAVVGAAELAAIGHAKTAMDQVRGSIAGFVASERELLDSRRRAVEATHARTQLILIVTTALSLAAILVATVMHHLQLHQRVLAQRSLRELNAGLEAQIGERTSALTRANAELVGNAQELAAVNRDLEAFSYSVSHDLRAPLRSMEGFSTLLVRKLKESLDPDSLRQLEIIRTSAQLMGRLISDVLAFSRLGREAMRPQPVALGDIARQVFAERKAELVGRQVELVVAPDLPPCFGDRSLLYLVLSNLLGNAIKYTRGQERDRTDPRAPDAARIELRAQAGGVPPAVSGLPPVPASQTVYVVADDGAGFDMAFFDKLFGVFQRLHPGESFEGTGIGLATVKRVIDRHRGVIWAESAPGAGARFSFTVCLDPTASPSELRPPPVAERRPLAAGEA